ncbi:MAG: DUF4236 domain-containing protein [Deltaproteobacteria bacterium]|nr:DUF4236 domain-containing protein [Deltaproteobacteria bacterium]MBW2305176.1 DUF4236 domain-containing protein [Deltaproteobacteria bacterium]
MPVGRRPWTARVNLSKSGGSLSFGPRGARFTIGPRGKRATVGIDARRPCLAPFGRTCWCVQISYPANLSGNRP